MIVVRKMRRKNVLRVGLAAAFICTGTLVGGNCAWAGFVLPDSGQTNCYATDGTQISCAGNGQDGDYVGPQPAYQDNGDGTITDLNTGLMWMQDSQGYSSSYPYYNYNDSISYCQGLSLGGYSDWRMPTLAERRTITHYGRTNPALATDKFLFHNYIYSSEWVSDEQVNNTGYKWLVCTNDGQAFTTYSSDDYFDCSGDNADGGTYNQGEYIRVRCVRTNQ